MTINTFPGDVLLLIFHFIRVGCRRTFPVTEKYYSGEGDLEMWRLSWWQPLVHVCRRWRSVVFESPNFLDLKLVCGQWTPVGHIGIWPPFPIIIRNQSHSFMPEDYDFDSAIMHRYRVCGIRLDLTSSQLQRLAAAMQEQFPALTHLTLESYCPTAPALPDGFLGGSAPHLQSLKLHSIPFPALPNLILSATDLVHLTLENIPHIGYISPGVLATSLAVLANLESLIIGFESPLSCPDREGRRPFPPTRTVLPALTSFGFRGVSEYLEDLVAQVDAPFLDDIWVTFFNQLLFDIPRLAHFIRHTARFKAPNEARANFHQYGVSVKFLPQTRAFGQRSKLLGISCTVLEWQLSSLAQLFTPFFPSIHMVEHLYIEAIYNLQPQWQDDAEKMQWLEFFHPFTAVKNLYVSKKFVRCIAPALQELVGERVTYVLPALENLFLGELLPSGPVQEAIGQFVAARQLLGHPVTVSHWNGR